MSKSRISRREFADQLEGLEADRHEGPGDRTARRVSNHATQRAAPRWVSKLTRRSCWLGSGDGAERNRRRRDRSDPGRWREMVAAGTMLAAAGAVGGDGDTPAF